MICQLNIAVSVRNPYMDEKLTLTMVQALLDNNYKLQNTLHNYSLEAFGQLNILNGFII